MRCAQLFNTKHAVFTGRQFLKLLFSMLCYHPQLGYLHTNIKFIPQEYGTKGKPKQCRKSNIYSSLFTQAKKSTWQTCCHIAIKIIISYHFLSEIPLILLSVPLLNIVLAFCEFTTLNWGSGFWSNCNSLSYCSRKLLRERYVSTYFVVDKFLRQFPWKVSL